MTETTYTCRGCQQVFPCTEIEVLGVRFKPTICNACDDADLKREADERQNVARIRRQAAYDELCPADYRGTVLERLPKPQKTQQVLQWTYGSKGLIVSGRPDDKKKEVRQGKTRSMWLLLHRIMVEEARSVVALTGGELAREIGAAYGAGGEMGMELFERLTEADVLFIDDFGKFKVSPRVEDEILGIVEHRTSHRRPILMTTNSDRAALEAAFSPDRRGPLFDRLREFCRGVNFDKIDP